MDAGDGGRVGHGSGRTSRRSKSAERGLPLTRAPSAREAPDQYEDPSLTDPEIGGHNGAYVFGSRSNTLRPDEGLDCQCLNVCLHVFSVQGCMRGGTCYYCHHPGHRRLGNSKRQVENRLNKLKAQYRADKDRAAAAPSAPPQQEDDVTIEPAILNRQVENSTAGGREPQEAAAKIDGPGSASSNPYTSGRMLPAVSQTQKKHSGEIIEHDRTKSSWMLYDLASGPGKGLLNS